MGGDELPNPRQRPAVQWAGLSCWGGDELPRAARRTRKREAVAPPRQRSGTAAGPSIMMLDFSISIASSLANVMLASAPS